MILVAIRSVVREDQVGGDAFQLLEGLLHLRSRVGQEAVPEPMHVDRGPSGTHQKPLCAEAGFLFARSIGAKYDPMHDGVPALPQKAENRPAAADLDVVGVGAEDQHDQLTVHDSWLRQLDHRFDPGSFRTRDQTVA